MDSSWSVRWGNTRLLIDPWLTGTEVDGFSWLNEQWHIVDPVNPVALGEFSAILISQPYSDHCHEATLKSMNADGKIFAVAPARKRLRKTFGQVSLIPDFTAVPLYIDELEIVKMTPGKWIDPIYHAMAISKGDETLFYAPHGFQLSAAQAEFLKDKRVKCLITTFTWFKIPAILGGLVNPGLEGVRRLADQIRPEKIVNTHDEQKKGRGLVLQTAKSIYPDFRKLPADLSGLFVAISNYEEKEI